MARNVNIDSHKCEALAAVSMLLYTIFLENLDS